MARTRVALVFVEDDEGWGMMGPAEVFSFSDTARYRRELQAAQEGTRHESDRR